MKRSKVTVFVLALASALLFSGCASIISGTTQQLTFISNPEGAEVNVSGRIIGKTPITTTLKKKSGQSVVFTKPGYKQMSLALDTRLDGWFWGNIVLGGFIGSTTDGISGGMNEYSQNQFMVSLIPEGTGAVDAAPSLSEEQKFRDYVVSSYDLILKDLSAGKGTYLDALFSKLNIPSDKRDETRKELLVLAQGSKSAPEFSDKVLKAHPLPK
jgi:hypothetical protein